MKKKALLNLQKAREPSFLIINKLFLFHLCWGSCYKWAIWSYWTCLSRRERSRNSSPIWTILKMYISLLLSSKNSSKTTSQTCLKNSNHRDMRNWALFITTWRNWAIMRLLCRRRFCFWRFLGRVLIWWLGGGCSWRRWSLPQGNFIQ